ncbi:YidH family protein [Caenimonas sp. SL110]|uniref:YidH family protein n=1 Tax=Caenimonas sp. SL110 TaxID=1450524 RepID=UPI0006543E8F|nr:DUF202 domain-containing protein [Caenimonas sp. SL110]
MSEQEGRLWRPRWQREGQAPDYRFSLANERTFLAWMRTALALLAGGVVLDQFASTLRPRWAVVGVAIFIAAWSGLLCVLAYRRWRDNEIAMRSEQPLPSASIVPLTGAFACLVCVLLLTLLLWR